MILGFIGTGAITEAMVTGLCDIGGFEERVLLTERTKERSSRLARAFSNVEVFNDNQTIVEQGECVVLAVMPEQLSDVLSTLRFRNDHRVISVVAGASLEVLRTLVSPAEKVYRAIPMPPAERGIGPIPICPPDASVEALFDRIGTAVPVRNERQFQAFAAGSALMATFFELVSSAARWLEKEGVPPKEAALYATSVFHALSTMTTEVSADRLQQMSTECLTAGGLNEQILQELRQQSWFDAVNERLDRIMIRLDEPTT